MGFCDSDFFDCVECIFGMGLYDCIVVWIDDKGDNLRFCVVFVVLKYL